MNIYILIIYSLYLLFLNFVSLKIVFFVFKLFHYFDFSANINKQWKEECEKLKSLISELKIKCAIKSERVAHLELMLSRADEKNNLLRQSEYSQRIADWNVASPTDITSLDSSISFCGKPIANPASPDLMVDLDQAELDIRSDEEGGSNGGAGPSHPSKDLDSESSSSFDFVSENFKMIDSPNSRVS